MVPVDMSTKLVAVGLPILIPCSLCAVLNLMEPIDAIFAPCAFRFGLRLLRHPARPVVAELHHMILRIRRRRVANHRLNREPPETRERKWQPGKPLFPSRFSRSWRISRWGSLIVVSVLRLPANPVKNAPQRKYSVQGGAAGAGGRPTSPQPERCKIPSHRLCGTAGWVQFPLCHP